MELVFSGECAHVSLEEVSISVHMNQWVLEMKIWPMCESYDKWVKEVLCSLHICFSRRVVSRRYGSVTLFDEVGCSTVAIILKRHGCAFKWLCHGSITRFWWLHHGSVVGFHMFCTFSSLMILHCGLLTWWWHDLATPSTMWNWLIVSNKL